MYQASVWMPSCAFPYSRTPQDGTVASFLMFQGGLSCIIRYASNLTFMCLAPAQSSKVVDDTPKWESTVLSQLLTISHATNRHSELFPLLNTHWVLCYLLTECTARDTGKVHIEAWLFFSFSFCFTLTPLRCLSST